MKKVLAICFLCVAPLQVQAQSLTITNILGDLISAGADLASGQDVDTELLGRKVVNSVAGGIQQQIIDDYYEDLEKQGQQEQLEKEYNEWAIKEDRKNGIARLDPREEYFRCRYYGTCSK